MRASITSAPVGWNSSERASSNSRGFLAQSDRLTSDFASHHQVVSLPPGPRTSERTEWQTSFRESSKPGITSAGVNR